MINKTASVENVLFARSSLSPANVAYGASGNPIIGGDKGELLVQIFVFKVTGKA